MTDTSLRSTFSLLAPLAMAATLSGCFIHVVGDDPEHPPAAQQTRPAAKPNARRQTPPRATPRAPGAKARPGNPLLGRRLNAVLTSRAYLARIRALQQKPAKPGTDAVLPEAVFFTPGKADLLAENDAVFQMVQDYLAAKPDVTKLRIEGHTSTDGEAEANMQLSKLRAMAVAQYLRSKGVDCKRLLPVAFGGTKPKFTPEKTEDDKAANNRVEFHEAERGGKAISDKAVDGGGTSAGDPCAGS